VTAAVVLANVSQVETASQHADPRGVVAGGGPTLVIMQTVVLTKRRAVDFCRVGSCACLMP